MKQHCVRDSFFHGMSRWEKYLYFPFYTLTSVCDQFPCSCDLNVWFRGDSHSTGPKNTLTYTGIKTIKLFYMCIRNIKNYWTVPVSDQQNNYFLNPIWGKSLTVTTGNLDTWQKPGAFFFFYFFFYYLYQFLFQSSGKQCFTSHRTP